MSDVTKRIENVGWWFLVANVANRGLVTSDPDAKTGVFTKELILQMKLKYKTKNTGGDLTHLFVSLEAIEDLRAEVVQIDEDTRRTILKKGEGNPPEFYGVEIWPLEELGRGQKLQKRYDNLGGTYIGDDVELVIGAEFNDIDMIGTIAGSF